ncbi:MAG TPA: hypothetical protein VFP37_08665 [Steroidobacteraceae bacterium]|nr:hypothetical protein [Steroidobacteraceae bacterium]
MKHGLAPFLALVATCAFAAPPPHDFSDDFEDRPSGQVPGAPWKEESYHSGAVIAVDTVHAFSGRKALHILTPRGADYRRGYVAIHLRDPLPQLQAAMYGRVMVWLDAVPGAQPVHWTLLQGEGRSADDRYNSIYRLGAEEQGGTQLMANFETTPPVSTDCRQTSRRTLPVRRWACVEFHMDVASNEMQFWLDGREVTRVRGRATAANACRGDDLGGQWLAPPRFDSFYLGFERYGDTPTDQHLWIDDVVLSRQRVGCPAKKS